MAAKTRFIKADDPYAPEVKKPLPEDATNLFPTPAATPSGPVTPQTKLFPPAAGITPRQSAQTPQMTAARTGAGKIPGGPINTILRPTVPGKPKIRTNSPILSVALKQVPTYVSPEAYKAEFWEKAINDPAKRQWLAKRAIALGYAKYDPKSPDLVAENEFNATGTGGGVYSMWIDYGAIAMMNPTLNLLTPEQLIDQRYNNKGGDSAFDALAKASVPNPIQKTTQTNTYTMSQVQADTIADRVATAVLGHMADEASMKKARKAMNSLMAANPTVSTSVSDATDPDNVKVSQHTNAGVGPDDAAAAYEMKLRRSSEGMAFGVGKLMEGAMALLDRGL